MSWDFIWIEDFWSAVLEAVTTGAANADESIWDFIGTKDFWSAVADIGTAGAAIAAAIIAHKGLQRWRKETLGKRRAELAEDTLASFYRIADVIHSARAPIVFKHELEPRDGDDPEYVKHNYFGPIARLRKQEDFIASFKAKRYQFTAHFGKEAAQPFDEISSILHLIRASCEAYIEDAEELSRFNDQSKDLILEWRRNAFRTSQCDPIEPRVANAVAAIEHICRPEIDEMSSIIIRSGHS